LQGLVKDDRHGPKICIDQDLVSHDVQDVFLVVCYTSDSTFKYINFWSLIPFSEVIKLADIPFLLLGDTIDTSLLEFKLIVPKVCNI
jgi:hypothetical protein